MFVELKRLEILTFSLNAPISILLAISPDPMRPMATEESCLKILLHTAGCMANTPGRNRWHSHRQAAKANGLNLDKPGKMMRSENTANDSTTISLLEEISFFQWLFHVKKQFEEF